jgi:hypothetical protein
MGKQVVSRLRFPTVITGILLTALSLTSCINNPTQTTTSTTGTTYPLSNIFTISSLKYQLFDVYPDYFWCDPDFYPVARPDTEQKNAIDQFITIRENQEEFFTILNYLRMPNQADYTDEEKLQIYREHKKLTYAVQMTPADSGYGFTIHLRQEQGVTYQGTISFSGLIDVTNQSSSFNTCPICLAEGTTIETIAGQTPVEKLQSRMSVYTLDTEGNKVIGTILRVASVPVSSSFEIIDIVLGDGRNISASPGHPTADGRTVWQLRVGDMLDGATIISVTSRPYSGYTYDILPDGGTGFYWANGILLKSTLAN